MGENVFLVDSAKSCALETRDILQEKNMIADESEYIQHNRSMFVVSDMPEKFRKIGARFLGFGIEKVEVVNIDEELPSEKILR
jgi:glutamate racemase